MPLRRPNLLDAFRRATNPADVRTGAQPEPVTPPPVAREVPAVRAAATAPQTRPAPQPQIQSAQAAARPGLSSRERVLIASLGATVLVLVAVVWLRSGPAVGSPEVSAAPPAPNPGVAGASPAGSAPTQAPAAGAAPAVAVQPARSGVDQQLHDPRNKKTVRLIQYPDDATSRALAVETMRWLAESGVPVSSPIQLAGGRGIVLCAGAGPTAGDLTQLRDTVRALQYPAGSKTTPFASAYIADIDSVLAR